MTSRRTPAPAGAPADRDVALGIEGFRFRDLHDVRRLPDLTAAFDHFMRSGDPDAFRALERYRAGHAAMSATEVSAILVQAAPWVGRFVGRLFGVEAEMARAAERTASEDPVLAFRRDFVQRRVGRKYGRSGAPYPALGGAGVAWPEELAGISAAPDPEKALASHVMALARREAALAAAGEGSAAALAGVRSQLEAAERYTAALLGDAERGPSSRYHAWASLRIPRPVQHDRLVQVIRPSGSLPNLAMGPVEHRRRRDGFKLTDHRMSRREILTEVDYCIYCHERDKDSCSKGFAAPAGSEGGRHRRNPLGIPLTGCPLDEKISEAHFVRGQGEVVGALALIAVDNPMAPGTGHRICNDCMKACIYQKQDPVNIPQIETGILTEVLELPYGFEIYSLLTRWNPLNVRRPHALPYNGFNVLVVGLGPAGYTLAHHLANEGFAVAGIDGLKIEPLPDDLTGADGLPPRPIRDVRALYRELDDRPLAGFGGVSEYGITVRWDKNFLAVLHLNLARRRKVRFYGGIRFGGTITVDEAWELGFDHIAIAAGAGRPTVIDMKNNLVRGIRKASDFLMALQLTGAFKRNALANLQVRLPAVVIGGGLTAIDTATELMAYYPVQVEKILLRYETLAAKHGEAAVRFDFRPEEIEILDELLAHGRAVREERERAKAAGERPDLARLVQQWGGVTICYRKGMKDSPAYRLNHEEIIKALEEGIGFAESMEPVEALADGHGHLSGMIFRRLDLPEDAPGALVTLPARACMVAAGTSPNVIYEKEHPGTFQRDDKGRFFLPHRAAMTPEGATPVPAGRGETGFFTSYRKDGRLVSFFGDNHPQYAGNVVKAMASAKDGAPRIAELFEQAVRAMPGGELPEREKRLERLWKTMDDELRCVVKEVNRLTPTIIEVVVRAPRQARNFHPGQFYRLQNFEAHAPVVEQTPLLIEPIALTGAWVDREQGLLSLIALELGASSRLCKRLKPGEPVLVMGPTGAPTEIVPGETVALVGGGLGNAVLFSIAKGMKEAGCRVIYFAGYKKPGDFFKREEIESSTDVVVYSVDQGEPIPTRRPQDRTMVGNIVQAMLAYAKGALGDAAIRLDACDRMIVIGSDVMMAAVTRARHGVLEPFLKPGHAAVASINSPMQCMMKEVCAQCLQRHIDPVTGEASVVFSCFNQDQPADRVDWAYLNQRLKQNTTLERLTNLWLERLLTVMDPAHIAR
ncbi:MAG TPA: FAD-dependent oxidoreductase [Candidatus Polarisedimenticolia bacterium]|nr:FAD-dependent oxidoreductase [Candidatus Polarisedimenticolia bacterium]